MNAKFILLAAGFMMTALIINAQTKNTMRKATFTAAQNEVMQVVLSMTEAFHKKDIQGVLACYEPNAVIVFEPEKPSSDIAAISEGFNGFFAVNPKFEYSRHERVGE